MSGSVVLDSLHQLNSDTDRLATEQVSLALVPGLRDLNGGQPSLIHQSVQRRSGDAELLANDGAADQFLVSLTHCLIVPRILALYIPVGYWYNETNGLRDIVPGGTAW